MNSEIMKRFFIYIFTLSCLLGCKSKKISTAAFHNYNTECLGISMDGTQTLRVWGTGRNRSDAIEQAKKKAVYDVVFVGIQAGRGECNSYPVIDEPNARKKYEDYFDLFFSNGGAYKEYVSAKNQKISALHRFKGDGTETFGIIVIVNRSALRQRFANDNIIIK